jgi:phosphatidylglycerol---prolipoprotein diacylglyceryl transferase
MADALGFRLFVPGYSALYAMAILACYFLSLYLAARRKIPLTAFSWACVLALLSMYFFSRVYFVILHPPDPSAGLFAELVSSGGTGSIGAYAGLVAGLYAACRVLRLSFPSAADCVGATLPIALVLGRLGCFMSGCCYGAPTDWPWGVRYPPGAPAYQKQLALGLLAPGRQLSLPVHPTQLYEAAAGLVLLAVLVPACRKLKKPGRALVLFFAGYSFLRFFIEFARGDQQRPMLGLSVPQLVICGSAVACVFILSFKGRKAHSEMEGHLT